MSEQGPAASDPSPWSDDPDRYLDRYIAENRQRLLRHRVMFKIAYGEREDVLQDAATRALHVLRQRTDHISSFEGWFGYLLSSVASHRYHRSTVEIPASEEDLREHAAFGAGPRRAPRVRREVATDPTDLVSPANSSTAEKAISDLEVGGLLEARTAIFARCRNAIGWTDLASPDVQARRRSANTERDLRVLAATTVAFFTALEREGTPDAQFTSHDASPVLAKTCLRSSVQPHYRSQTDARDKYVDRNEADAYWAIGACLWAVIGPKDPHVRDADATAPSDLQGHEVIVRLGAWRILRAMQRSTVEPLVQRLGGFITAKDPTGRPRFTACRFWLDGTLTWLGRAGDVEQFVATVRGAAAWLAAPGATQASPIALARVCITEDGPKRSEAEQLVATDARLHAIVQERAA